MRVVNVSNMIIGEAIAPEPDDLVATSTPAGIGYAWSPRRVRRQGDVCEVEIEGGGILRNPIVDETR